MVCRGYIEGDIIEFVELYAAFYDILKDYSMQEVWDSKRVYVLNCDEDFGYDLRFEHLDDELIRITSIAKKNLEYFI